MAVEGGTTLAEIDFTVDTSGKIMPGFQSFIDNSTSPILDWDLRPSTTNSFSYNGVIAPVSLDPIRVSAVNITLSNPFANVAYDWSGARADMPVSPIDVSVSELFHRPGATVIDAGRLLHPREIK